MMEPDCFCAALGGSGVFAVEKSRGESFRLWGARFLL